MEVRLSELLPQRLFDTFSHAFQQRQYQIKSASDLLAHLTTGQHVQLLMPQGSGHSLISTLIIAGWLSNRVGTKEKVMVIVQDTAAKTRYLRQAQWLQCEFDLIALDQTVRDTPSFMQAVFDENHVVIVTPDRLDRLIRKGIVGFDLLAMFTLIVIDGVSVEIPKPETVVGKTKLNLQTFLAAFQAKETRYALFGPELIEQTRNTDWPNDLVFHAVAPTPESLGAFTASSRRKSQIAFEPRVRQPDIDYVDILAFSNTDDLEAQIEFLADEIAHCCADVYKQTHPNIPDIFSIDAHGFTTFFDFSTGVVDRGDLKYEEAVEDRVVVVFGRSRRLGTARDNAYIRGYPGQPGADRGHYVAHSAGGEDQGLNLFPIRIELNRGWSSQGKRYRTMERFLAKNVGTFYFVRPIYENDTYRPSFLEYGILRGLNDLWVECFDNQPDMFGT
jgi:hypothetical protein